MWLIAPHTQTKPLFDYFFFQSESFVILFRISLCLLFMASSSSVSCSWLYDVFLSFRGEDVRKGFLSHVVKEFKSKGISPFIDSEMERGQSVGPGLVGAIRQSRVAIVLLSRNYASSSWCLGELVEIMKCREEDKQRVITIFYEVDPSEVRKQTGDFGKAFDETCVGKTEEVTHVWRQALKEVAGIAGYASSNCGSEADLINELASNVMGVLALTPSNDFDDFVGIEARVTEMKTMLSLQTKEVKVIGIWGPAGIGKTTAARVLYDQVSPGFSFSTFLENIKGCFERSCGNDHQLKLRFQEKLLSQIFNQKDIVVGHLRGAPERLCDKKVLVVLDEVDSWWQLEEMSKRAWFGPGSMIIITTEDRKLLKALKLEANQIYEMKFPARHEAFQIFCLYAFDQKFPNNGFEGLAWEVTELAGNLPLGLRVMGSYLRGMSKNEWIDALPSLRSSLNSEIESTLRLSYNVLSDKEKDLFLHIACFLADFKVDTVKTLLEKSDLNVNHGLQSLANRSLISIEEGFIRMHSLLQQMGKEIVYGQSAEPGKRQFLTKSTEISDIFDENSGTGTVLGISFPCLLKELPISKRAFEGMNNLQFIYFAGGTLKLPECLNYLPEKLRFIYWNQAPMRFWPSKFSGKFLVELIMPNSNFEKLWEGIKPFPFLKRMDFGNSPYLKEIPNLSKATRLEVLNLSLCDRLLELPSSIGRLINLEELNLSYCGSLEKRSGCSSLEKISGCSSLKELDLSYSGIGALELPSSIRTWSCLYRLDMSGLSDLKKFPNVPYSIVELVLHNTGIEEIPPWIEKLYCLQELFMTGCDKLEIVSPNISKLENLQTIDLLKGGGGHMEMIYDDGYFEAEMKWGPDLKRRWKLRSDLDIHYILPICLQEKSLTSPTSLCLTSDSLKIIPDCIRRLSGLSELKITACRKLTALPQLPGSCLSLDAHFCRSLRRIDSSFQNPNICLNFAGCFNLSQKARKLIQTSACKYALLPGKNVHAHFTHRAISGSLTIHLTPRPLPPFFRFKACILLSEDNSRNLCGPWTVSCRVSGKQNGHTVPYGSDRLHHMSCLGSSRNHLYIFEDSLSLNQQYPEAEDPTFSELSFIFTVDDGKALVVEGCGVRLLDVLDGKETEYEEYIEANNENATDDGEEDEVGDDSESAHDDDDDFEEDVEDAVDDNDPGCSDEVSDTNIEANNQNADEDDDDEEDEGGDDSESVVDDNNDTDDVEEDIEDDVDDNDPGFSDEVIDIKIEANNETEEGKVSGRDEGAETRSRKRMRSSLV
ncbi:disease resistance-like protein DSC2 isoform X1 [Raphanus sativus]|uniref:ADP-ribosyl cyclase/cyclic ADP-ribose hydrolase n=2 Tax=Raphanus sativus TaxID=3726 RepID=A0A9W3DBH9_RAPSA|nr:disease resistance-like protein DSC2 isoform X1 [Raphanus sativus]